MNLYREFPPPPALAAHVACLWTSHALPAGAPVRHRVLPDNCIDILWQDRMPLGFVAGMMSRARVVEFAAPVRTVAVRFRPGAARAFLDLPLHELQDGQPALDELWPRAEAERLAAALWEHEQSGAQMLRTIADWLVARLRACTHAQPGTRADALARQAVTLLERSGGTLRVEQLATALGVSRQHLALAFRERVGLNAKSFAMVCRFQNANAALRATATSAIDWARFANDTGYYDQSHLIHEFRLFAGQTPDAMLRPRAA